MAHSIALAALEESEMSFNIWMILALCCAVGYGAGYCWRDGNSWHRSAIKTAAMALLAIGGAQAGAPTWVVAGLGLGAIGDFFLSRRGTGMFLAGMAAFAAGHLAYAVYFAGLADVSAAFFLMTAALIGLAATTEVWLAPHTGVLRWPVRGYVGVITVMGIAALAQTGPLFLAGAGLFIVSDILLSLLLFVLPTARLRWILAVALWTAYWLGQFLILQGGLGPISGA